MEKHNFQWLIPTCLIAILYLTPLMYHSLDVLGTGGLLLLYLLFTICLGVFYATELSHHIGDVYFVFGNKTKAKVHYIRAILDNTRSATVYLHYGLLLIEEENYEQALAHLYVAGSLGRSRYIYHQVMTQTAHCYYCLGLQEEQAGNSQQAKRFFDKSYSYDKHKTP